MIRDAGEVCCLGFVRGVLDRCGMRCAVCGVRWMAINVRERFRFSGESADCKTFRDLNAG